MEGNHNPKGCHRVLPAVDHGDGNAPRVRIDHTGQLGESGVRGLGEQRPHGFRRHLSLRIHELRQIFPLHRLALVRHQGEAGGRDVDRHPASDLGPVCHGSAAGKPFHEQGLPAVQHRQVHVLVEDLLDVLHEWHGSLPQSQGGRVPVYQFPQPQPQPDRPAAAGFQQPVRRELPDQPVGSGERQA